MPRSSLPLVFALATLGVTTGRAQDSPPAKEAPLENIEDIVVTARKGAPPPKLDAVGYYQRYCFDANRLTGQSAPPFDDHAWNILDDELRARFNITDPEVPAFSLVDAERGTTLLLKFERSLGSGGVRESKCTMVIIGGGDHDRLPGQVAGVFRGPGTQRHVGHRSWGKGPKGWRWWLWTGMPGRRSKSWQTVSNEMRNNPVGDWITVYDLAFYNDYDYIVGDLKTKLEGSKPLSVLSFVYVTKASKK